MTIVGLLVFLLVFGLIWWGANALCVAFKITDPVATVVQVVIVIFGILYLLQAVAGLPLGLRIQ